MQRVEGQRAPQLAFHVEADAHAVMHRQRLAGVVLEQAVIGVGQAAVRLEPGGLAGGHDCRQPRMLADQEAPAERLVHQPGGGHRTQAVVLQAQQPYRAAVELFAQGLHQALQADGAGQFGAQIGECECIHDGQFNP
ncbi:hypothetical protein D3C81_1157000 [compost metagenome]